MPARRCSSCSLDWPTDYIKPAGVYMQQSYKCPACGNATSMLSNQDPISLSEANHAAFEGYYDRREKARDAEAAKALELLKAQAQEIADLPEAEAA